MLFLSIMFPWLVLFINDDPMGAFIAMVLQVTVIGWIPASLWAWKSVKKNAADKKPATKSERRDVV